MLKIKPRYLTQKAPSGKSRVLTLHPGKIRSGELEGLKIDFSKMNDLNFELHDYLIKGTGKTDSNTFIRVSHSKWKQGDFTHLTDKTGYHYIQDGKKFQVKDTAGGIHEFTYHETNPLTRILPENLTQEKTISEKPAEVKDLKTQISNAFNQRGQENTVRALQKLIEEGNHKRNEVIEAVKTHPSRESLLLNLGEAFKRIKEKNKKRN